MTPSSPPRSGADICRNRLARSPWRELAYGHFVERGGVDGHDLDDWLKAEAQVEKTCHDEMRAAASATPEH